VRFVIIVFIIVAIVDIMGFYAFWKDMVKVTAPFVVGMILGTAIPITINLWYWLVYMKA
jgi:hypothetical protein